MPATVFLSHSQSSICIFLCIFCATLDIWHIQIRYERRRRRCNNAQLPHFFVCSFGRSFVCWLFSLVRSAFFFVGALCFVLLLFARFNRFLLIYDWIFIYLLLFIIHTLTLTLTHSHTHTSNRNYCDCCNNNRIYFFASFAVFNLFLFLFLFCLCVCASINWATVNVNCAAAFG